MEQPCLVIGGVREAEDKAGRLLAAGARLTVVSPSATPALVEWAAAGRLSTSPALLCGARPRWRVLGAEHRARQRVDGAGVRTRLGAQDPDQLLRQPGLFQLWHGGLGASGPLAAEHLYLQRQPCAIQSLAARSRRNFRRGICFVPRLLGRGAPAGARTGRRPRDALCPAALFGQRLPLGRDAALSSRLEAARGRAADV